MGAVTISYRVAPPRTVSRQLAGSRGPREFRYRAADLPCQMSLYVEDHDHARAAVAPLVDAVELAWAKLPADVRARWAAWPPVREILLGTFPDERPVAGCCSRNGWVGLYGEVLTRVQQPRDRAALVLHELAHAELWAQGVEHNERQVRAAVVELGLDDMPASRVLGRMWRQPRRRKARRAAAPLPPVSLETATELGYDELPDPTESLLDLSEQLAAGPGWRVARDRKNRRCYVHTTGIMTYSKPSAAAAAAADRMGRR